MPSPKKKLPTFITLHIRLDNNNYTFWRSQILATVRAHNFEDVLLCSSAPTDVVSCDGSSTSGLGLLDWNKRDQFLLSWILSSITESMLGHVS